MGRTFNLILVGVWAGTAAAIFYMQAVNPQAPLTVRFGGADFSLGWVAVALAGYNLLRWFMGFALRPAKPVAPPRRRERSEDRPAEYNPAFDFSRPDEETPDEPTPR